MVEDATGLTSDAKKQEPKRLILSLNEYGYRIGMSHHNAKISDEMVDQIRSLHEEGGIGYRRIAKMFKLTKSSVQKICNYERRAQTPMGYKTIRTDDDSKT